MPKPVARLLTNTAKEKGSVAQLQHGRGLYILFKLSILPLQVVPSLACSVASLSPFPGHYQSGADHLHDLPLTAHLLG